MSAFHKSNLVYRQLLSLASCKTGESTAETQCREFAFTLDQSADRNLQSTREGNGETIVAPCVLPGQWLWLHIPGGEERLLLGREALMWQGFPVCRADTDQVPERFLQDLAGNAMTLHVLLAVVQAAMAALTWKAADQTHAISEKEELNSAYALLDMLRK